MKVPEDSSAVAQGHARALFYLAVSYDDGVGVRRDVGEAMRLYRRAAVRGRRS